MPLNKLNKHDKSVLHACLECVVSGQVILHDAEFQTIMGISPLELRMVLEGWPELDENDERVCLAINNSINNLLGYPHAWHERWDEILKYPKAELRRVLRKWRAQRAE